MSRARSASGSALPTSVSASSSLSLRIVTCRSASPTSPSLAAGPGPRDARGPGRRREGPPVRGERGERVRGELGADESADVDPARVAYRLECLRRRPRLTDGVLAHDPPLALVVEAVRGRRASDSYQATGRPKLSSARRRTRHPRRRRPPRRGRRPERARARGPSTTPLPRARRRTGDDVSGEVADGGDVAHAGSAPGGRAARDECDDARDARTRRGSSARSRRSPRRAGRGSRTRSTHQPGPVGKSHW